MAKLPYFKTRFSCASSLMHSSFNIMIQHSSVFSDCSRHSRPIHLCLLGDVASTMQVVLEMALSNEPRSFVDFVNIPELAEASRCYFVSSA